MIQGEVVHSLWECERALSEEAAFDLMVGAKGEGVVDGAIRVDVHPTIHHAVIVEDDDGPRIQGVLAPCYHPFMFRGGTTEFLGYLAKTAFPVVCKYCQEKLKGEASNAS